MSPNTKGEAMKTDTRANRIIMSRVNEFIYDGNHMTDVICKTCGWRGPRADCLVGPHPFTHGDLIYGCPQCRDVECFAVACDEVGCWMPITCGTPTAAGYRQTCSKHRPDAEKDQS